ncbi:restriction endonuclease subunit S [Haematospirillum sp. H1815]|uniref:restriction endonuclease subunit S n=1 Tax=Haematospirillum sp. H1815 TaxID=2723108 RepID=UPI00143A83ED|nr:restriction endonuclease subunit S [Haematospirillum sp. H1815]NKD77536.1 restriction endonuclease subunit S [Haematospirillum sp. H1815]
MSFPRYPAYKNSGIKWLGEVPEHWEAVPLWTLFRRTKRTGFPDEELLSVYRDYGVVPKASRDDNFNNASEDLTSYQLVEPRCLAINKMKAWQGSVGISRYRGIVSPAYFIYEPLHDCSSEYLHYLLRSLEYTAAYRMVSKGIRVNQWDLDPQYHSRLPVLLPPKAEQSVIAAFLDRETGKIDALVAEQEKLIGLLKEKRQAVISHAVTKGLDPSAPMKDSGIKWLGKVPAHWDVKRLRFVATINPPKSEVAGRDREEEVSFLPMEAIGYDGSLDLERTRTIGDVETGYTYFREGDVTIAKITPCFENGKGAVMRNLIGGIGFGTTELIVARPGEAEATSDFLYWLFASVLFRKRGEATMYGSGGQKRVPDDFVRDFSTGFPSVSEQSAIAAFLDEQTAKFDTLIAEAQRAIALLKEHRSALISAAVTGKIDVRNCVALQEVA